MSVALDLFRRIGSWRTGDGPAARVFVGAGSPEGAVYAGVGSAYLRTDSATTLYIKQTGTGNTGWVAK